MAAGNGSSPRAEVRAGMLTMMSSRPGNLAALRRRAETDLGAADPLTLLVACKSEAYASRTRPVSRSVPAWERLARSAAGALGSDDPARLEIVSRYGRWLGRRGGPGDLDRAVRHHRAELRRRESSLGERAYWTGVVRLDLAVVLVERAILGRLDPAVRSPARADLAEARQLSEREIEHRRAVPGPGGGCVRQAREVAARVTLGKALLDQEGDGAAAERGRLLAAQVAGLTGDLMAGRLVRWEPRLLRCLLLRARALLAAGLREEAEAGARLAVELQRGGRDGWPGGVDPGLAALTLARVLAGADRAEAAVAARGALRARLAWFPENSVYCAEAREQLASCTRE